MFAEIEKLPILLDGGEYESIQDVLIKEDDYYFQFSLGSCMVNANSKEFHFDELHRLKWEMSNQYILYARFGYYLASLSIYTNKTHPLDEDMSHVPCRFYDEPVMGEPVEEKKDK